METKDSGKATQELIIGLMVTCILARFKISNNLKIWSNPACPSFANGRPPVLISSGIWHQKLNIVKSTNTVQSGSVFQDTPAKEPKNPVGYNLTSFKKLLWKIAIIIPNI